MTFDDMILKWCKGDELAQRFLLTVWDAAQIWDDLEDHGRSDHTNQMISWLAFGKEFTPFFAANSAILRPALLFMYLQWQAANVLEQGDEYDIEKAYMLRAGYYGVIHTVTWIIGGEEWSQKCGPEIYRAYGETLAELKEEMRNA